jgi:hypothetical protein
MLIFELYRRKAVGMTMPAFRVVEHLDVIEDIAARLFAVGVDLSTNPLPLE